MKTYLKITLIFNLLLLPIKVMAIEVDTFSLQSINNPIYNATGNDNDLGKLFNNIFFLFLAIAIVLAIAGIIRAGYEYMTSSDSGDKKGRAKSRLQASFGGLLLALGSVIILNTINPGLTTININFPKLKAVQLPPELRPFDLDNDNKLSPQETAAYEQSLGLPQGTLDNWDRQELEEYIASLPGTTRSTDGRLHFTTYRSVGDSTPDRLTTAGFGNNNNLLIPGSVALSPDLISKYKPKPGQEVFVNGRSVGYYDDTSASSDKGTSIVNTIDIYDPSGSIGDQLKGIPAGGWSLRFGEVRQQPRHPNTN